MVFQQRGLLWLGSAVRYTVPGTHVIILKYLHASFVKAAPRLVASGKPFSITFFLSFFLLFWKGGVRETIFLVCCATSI